MAETVVRDHAVTKFRSNWVTRTAPHGFARPLGCRPVGINTRLCGCRYPLWAVVWIRISAWTERLSVVVPESTNCSQRIWTSLPKTRFQWAAGITDDANAGRRHLDALIGDRAPASCARPTSNTVPR